MKRVATIRGMLGVLGVVFVTATEAFSQIVVTVNVGTQMVFITDNGLYDLNNPALNDIRFDSTILPFPPFTPLAGCEVKGQVYLVIGAGSATLTVTNLFVDRVTLAGPPTIHVEVIVDGPLGATIISPPSTGFANLNGFFVDALPLGNISVDMDAFFGSGPPFPLGPFISPPPFASPPAIVPLNAPSNSMAAVLNFYVTDVGDRVVLTTSADVSVEATGAPTVSAWGLVVLTSLLLTGIVIKFGRRRAAV